MVTPSIGGIVTVRFPFSDLEGSKLRPALVLADAGMGDWVLCQLTSNAYADLSAIRIEDEDFQRGSLHRTSYARPGKLFTASETLMEKEVGILRDATFRKVMGAVIRMFQNSLSI